MSTFFPIFPILNGPSSSGRNKVGVVRTNQISGQIIATSHDLTPNGGLVREIPLFQGNLGW